MAEQLKVRIVEFSFSSEKAFNRKDRKDAQGRKEILRELCDVFAFFAVKSFDIHSRR